jgi:hypothetical protein
LIEFQRRFPDAAACVEYLFAARWPEGFVFPSCGSSKAWELQTKACSMPLRSRMVVRATPAFRRLPSANVNGRPARRPENVAIDDRVPTRGHGPGAAQQSVLGREDRRAIKPVWEMSERAGRQCRANEILPVADLKLGRGGCPRRDKRRGPAGMLLHEPAVKLPV